MPEEKWRSPLVDWESNNQDPNLAFTLVARNERAKQMWADPHNSSRYVPASFTREKTSDESFEGDESNMLGHSNDNKQLRAKKKQETEPALRFLFNDWPRNFANGYVLGSDVKTCDALLGDPGRDISEQMLAFSFNRQHDLVMNVTSEKKTWIKFKNQKEARRIHFSWIFPRNQKKIHVKMADGLRFVVVMPKYGINEHEFRQNCESFLSSAAHGDSLADSSDITSGPSSPWDPFYLLGKKLGKGAYGNVFETLRMPDGKVFAAKQFESLKSFRQEVQMLKKVCEVPHKNIVQFVEPWCGDYKPLLIMEYVAGGSLQQQLKETMVFSEIAKLANQLLVALKFLHDQGVMHRDIKPANILCVTRSHYKLADFGVSREVAPFVSKQGTLEYMAPEVHDLEPYSYPADMWSLGVLLFQCMNGLPAGPPGVSRPGAAGRKWCKVVFEDFTFYLRQCIQQPDMEGSFDLELVLLVQKAMLCMDPVDRWSTRGYLEFYSHLWEGLDGGEEDSDTGSGAKTPTETHPNGSFASQFPKVIVDDEAEEATVRSNGGGTRGEGKAPQNFHNEDRSAAATHATVDPSFQGNYFPPLPSLGESIGESLGESFGLVGNSDRTSDPHEGTPYDPANVVFGPLFVSDNEDDAHSIPDGQVKRKRHSQPSQEGGREDGLPSPHARAGSWNQVPKRSKMSHACELNSTSAAYDTKPEQ